jgi:UDP-glucose:(heptosyl)LPS alpha-1,3-glucosyltransferase
VRIGICHENVLPARGGAEMYVADLTRRLAAAGHKVHLFATRWDAAAIPASVRCHAVAPAPGRRPQRPVRFSEALAAALDGQPVDVSIGFDKVAGTDVYYPLGGLHVASARHNLLKHPPGLSRALARLVQRLDPAQRAFRRFERELLTGANRPLLVANSRLVRRHAHDFYRLDPAAVPVVHNAIDPSRFDETDRPRLREQMRDEWQIAPGAVVGACVAMNYRLKGVEPLLNALRRASDAASLTLVIAGSAKIGPYRRLAERLGVGGRVRFIGHCGDVRRVFFAADFLVHPTFYDPCSLVVLEALACGLPVITTKNNGAAELLRPPAEGFVLDDPHDVDALAARLTDLCDPQRRWACSRAARQAAAGWTIDHHVRAMEAVPADAAARRSRAAG